MNRTKGSTLGPRAMNVGSFNYMGSFNYFEPVEMLMAIKTFYRFSVKFKI